MKKTIDEEVWNKWFAWHPVKTFAPNIDCWTEKNKKEEWTWLKTVERKYDHMDVMNITGCWWHRRIK